MESSLQRNEFKWNRVYMETSYVETSLHGNEFKWNRVYMETSLHETSLRVEGCSVSLPQGLNFTSLSTSEVIKSLL